MMVLPVVVLTIPAPVVAVVVASKGPRIVVAGVNAQRRRWGAARTVHASAGRPAAASAGAAATAAAPRRRWQPAAG